MGYVNVGCVGGGLGSAVQDRGTERANRAQIGRNAPARRNFCASLAVRSGCAVTAVAQCVATCVRLQLSQAVRSSTGCCSGIAWWPGTGPAGVSWVNCGWNCVWSTRSVHHATTGAVVCTTALCQRVARRERWLPRVP